jgi:hypothetical protein
MTTVSKEDKRTRNRRRSSNNNNTNNNNKATTTNNTNTKENRPASRGRRNLKKNEEKLPVGEKPVIGSSNPFFIAVCAPDSYKPAAVAPIMPTTTGQQRVKPNVFLRSRPRSAPYSNGGDGGSGGYSNRFIHHPALQQSRQSNTSTSAASPSSEAGGNGQNNVISISDLTHFPSLGANTEAPVVTAPVKLNFKEMITRSAGVASPSVASPSVASPSVASTIIPQKMLSSSNIFLAAFQPSVRNDYDDDHNYACDDHADVVVGAGNKRQPELVSSVLIDSCDNKYDRLYK